MDVHSIVTSVPLMLLHLPHFSGWESFLREDECEDSAFIVLAWLCLVDDRYLEMAYIHIIQWFNTTE